jgi:hypothetical protein
VLSTSSLDESQAHPDQRLGNRLRLVQADGVVKLLPSIGAVLVIAAVCASSVAASTTGTTARCRKVSPATLTAIRKGVVAGQPLRSPGYVVASGVPTMPWFVAARFPNRGIGVWITNLSPTGSPAPKHAVIKSADAAAGQWSSWPGYLGLAGRTTNPAQGQVVTALAFCVLRNVPDH